MTSVQIDTWDVLAVAADPVRRRILGLLADEQLCTCHLVEELGLKQPLVSHHLRVLREADLVEAEPCGRFTYYRLRPEVLAGAAAALGALAARGEPARRPC
ncbi:MAG: transcriptional regulator [Frankiales bacterium]|nr:transcriptional regulator [Frankiales bacterium]